MDIFKKFLGGNREDVVPLNYRDVASKRHAPDTGKTNTSYEERMAMQRKKEAQRWAEDPGQKKYETALEEKRAEVAARKQAEEVRLQIDSMTKSDDPQERRAA